MPSKQPKNDNMRLWDQVCKTDPAHTKPVSFGRKFTSVDAQYQVQRATELFGPVGFGWSYDAKYDYISQAGYVFAVADVCINYTLDGKLCTYGPVRATNLLVDIGKDGKTRPDDDAFKKAMTDALTKGLSHLGFSADVFLGQYDDNKYVQSLRNEFREKANAGQKAAQETPAAASQPASSGEESGEPNRPPVGDTTEDDGEAFLNKINEAKALKHLENLYTKYRSFIEIHARKSDFLAAFKARKAALLKEMDENNQSLAESTV